MVRKPFSTSHGDVTSAGSRAPFCAGLAVDRSEGVERRTKSPIKLHREAPNSFSPSPRLFRTGLRQWRRWVGVFCWSVVGVGEAAVRRRCVCA